MASINSGSVRQKLVSAMSAGSFMGNVSNIARSKYAEPAGDALVNCIENAISSSGLSGGAIAAIGSVHKDSVTETGTVPGQRVSFEVGVSIDQQSRPSLIPVEGVSDMASLLDRGYSARIRVYGEWHGAYIGSLQHRSPTHFVQNGVSNFNASYGSAYGAHAEVTSDRFM